VGALLSVVLLLLRLMHKRILSYSLR